ncbi:conserved hypothetical protein [Ricinus communis]|uniref:Uncharacterized protein n=1 Tax=Ricinus communis TaxID=3988 RepID=B9T584_RICCO|nr:conserved hypothetical protein [Ricinus communis]
MVEKEAENYEKDVICDPDDGNDKGEDDEQNDVCVVEKFVLKCKSDDDTQKLRLFRTRCTVLEKRFNMIINI